MYKILFVLLLLICSFVSVFTCMASNSPKSDVRKNNDLRVTKQLALLDQCVHGKPGDTNMLLDAYADILTEELLAKSANPTILNRFGYRECYKIIAEHKAKLVICPEYTEKHGADDVLKDNTKEEYNECVKEKNEQLKKLLAYKG